MIRLEFQFGEFKGLLLKSIDPIEGDLAVFTGKNGGGKTRVFSGIAEGKVRVSIDGESVSIGGVKYFEHKALMPEWHNSYSDVENKKSLTNLLWIFEKSKEVFDHPLGEIPNAKWFDVGVPVVAGAPKSMSLAEAHKCLWRIASILGKQPSELEVGEIKAHFSGVTAGLFGVQNLSRIFNNYLRLRCENSYRLWRKQTRGENNCAMDEERFEEVRGAAPWVILNDIVNEILGGKFRFSFPSTEEPDLDFQARLVEVATGAELEVSSLSSGEQTLLWLTLLVFNIYLEGLGGSPVKLLLLDEPDAFLHPSMVKRLLETLKLFKDRFGVTSLITTHSPTTVALAPGKLIYLLERSELKGVSKDEAIAGLLEGVPQISIDAQNRRQVCVESFNDVWVYEPIYIKLRQMGKLCSPVGLSFVASGKKVSAEDLEQAVRSILGVNDSELIGRFVESVNGVGSCSQVKEMVRLFSAGSCKTVRGLVDWDNTNKSRDNVVVLGEGEAYTIENIAIDPVAILIVLHIEFRASYPMLKVCGKEVGWVEFLHDRELLQSAVDRFYTRVLGRDSAGDIDLEYCNGVVLKGDREYMMIKGDEVEERVAKAYPQLKSYFEGKQGFQKQLKYTLVDRGMIGLTDGQFIPKLFLDAFVRLQA